MKTLAIDIETYSSVSLQKSGVYAYAQSDDFDILLFGYAWDDGPVEVIDLARGQSLPQELQNALYDPEILKLVSSVLKLGLADFVQPISCSKLAELMRCRTFFGVLACSCRELLLELRARGAGQPARRSACGEECVLSHLRSPALS